MVISSTACGGNARVCTAFTCTGCCNGTICESGTTTAICGANGAACVTCSAAGTCNAGVCSSVGSSQPLIGATLFDFPPGAAPPGYSSDAFVAVIDPVARAVIKNAAVTVNGTALPFSDSYQAYLSIFDVNPAAHVTVTVTVGGRQYIASGTQFTSYPTISTPAAGATWFAAAANQVTWSGGSPTANAVYALGVLDAANPNGALLWPGNDLLQEVPTTGTSFTLPTDAVTGGSRLLVVGLLEAFPFLGAAQGSGLVLGGFSYVPLRVIDDSGRFWSLAQTTGIPQYTTLRGVVWTGSQFVVVGDAEVLGGTGCQQYGIILTSPDGLAWTQRVSCADVTTVLLSGVAWSGTQFVTVGGPGIMTSPDGATWTEQSGGSGHFLHRVAWCGTFFVTVGDGGVVLTSPDGSVWTPRTSGTATNLNGIACSGAGVIAVGDSGTILSSPDGKTWSPATSSTPAGLINVSWTGTEFIAVGTGGTILTSANGSTWTPQVSNLTDTLYGVCTSGRHFVAVGPRGVIVNSNDGATWTPRPPNMLVDLWSVVWTGTRYLAVGELSIIMTSP